MIVVTRLDKQRMYLNPDHIICIEETPDTVVTLFNGNRYIVIDRANAIIDRVIAFRAKISRRASSRSVKKYLGRSKFSQFHCDRHLQDDTGTHGTHNQTPFHSRDY
ncbi:MAG: flagellar FlbD family protein [Geobacteraceae bacterium]|jgi:flagellar protein FlbD|nr:flagellar FlbD family protein [Geobacteraceae bacterium]NTW79981.1 flagellar FlbD family protein [Geobacteraceae bacterium]